MTLLLKLLIAHFIGDFVLQPQSWVKDKEQKKIKSAKLYLHILIHLASIFALTYGYENATLIVLISVGSHFLIDLMKLYLNGRLDNRLNFGLDQFLHLMIIFILVHRFEPFVGTLLIDNNELLLYGMSLLFITYVSSVIIKVIISYWTPQTNEREDESLIKAGQIIGMLERLFVFSFIVTNHWEAVGFLLAAKSVFRFGDLKESKDRMLTEYILIGTLLSFGLAILAGIVHIRLSAIV